MKYQKLHFEIQNRLSNLVGTLDENTDIILSQQDYDQLFWDLIKLQKNKRFRGKKIDLVAQLNSYIDSNRDAYDASFRIKNPSKVIRPSPPLREENVSDVHEIESVDQFFTKSLILEDYLDESLFGRLLYCAARHGGLLNKALLTSFMHCILNRNLKSAEGLIWLELKGSANEVYQWFPDNLSLLLIYQWLNSPNSFEAAKLPEHYIRKFWLLNPGHTRTILKLTWLFNTINARLSLSITPFALGILTGKQVNLPLKQQPHLRLLSQNSPPLFVDEIDKIDKEKLASSKMALIESPASVVADFKSSYQLLRWTRLQLNAFKKDLHKFNSAEPDKIKVGGLAQAIKSKLQETSENITPIVRVLIEWSHSRLTQKSRWSSKLKPSTLSSYLGSISTLLQEYIGYRDPLSLHVDELADIYLLIIDTGRNTAVKARRARILRDFHTLLEFNYQAAPCYIFQEFIAAGIRDQANLVDANILMPWEYNTALEFLQQSEELTGLFGLKRKAVLIALILGFRCGLRRSELLFINLNDLEWDLNQSSTVPEWATIIISPSQARNLKSISAERRLPIGLLLNQIERNIFADYCNERLLLGQVDSEFLFYFGESAKLLAREAQVVNPDHLFTPLTKLLQRVTGDNSFRYHHLRHSCATWLFWYWTADIHKFSHPISSLQPHPNFEHLVIARETLIHRNSQTPSRKILHAISALIGHSGPSITLFHYIHSASWLIWSDLEQQVPAVIESANAALSSLSVRTLFRYKDDLDKTSEFFNGFNRAIHRKLTKVADKIPTSKWHKMSADQISTLQYTLPVQINELKVYQALLSHFKHDTHKKLCIAHFNISEQVFEKALKNVRYFFSQQQSPHLHGKRPLRFKNSQRLLYAENLKIPQAAVDNLPHFPITRSAQSLLSLLLTQYNELPAADKQRVLAVAKYLVDFGDVQWSNIRFRLDPVLERDGKYWLQQWFNAIKLLDKDGELLKQVRLTLVTRYEVGSDERAQYWQLWTNGLPQCIQVDRCNKDYPKAAALQLDVMTELTKTASTEDHTNQRLTSDSNYRIPANPGFRLAFYILFFIYCELSEVTAR